MMIRKIAFAVIRDGRLLLCRKRGLKALILPGGKPETGEHPLDCLAREVKEELGVRIRAAAFIGTFTDDAAGIKATIVLELYGGSLNGEPSPNAEIEELVWFAPGDTATLSPSLERQIVPDLVKRGLLG